jgi:tRNA 2-thiouridine synthesizing protein A
MDAGARGGYAQDMSDETDRIDATGMLCPLPVLRLRKRLEAHSRGALVVLEATDRAALIDVPHFCAEAGHALEGAEETEDGRLLFTVRKG